MVLIDTETTGLREIPEDRVLEMGIGNMMRFREISLRYIQR